MHFKLKEDFVVVWDVDWIAAVLDEKREVRFLKEQHLVYRGRIVVWDVGCADENLLKMI